MKMQKVDKILYYSMHDININRSTRWRVVGCF